MVTVAVTVTVTVTVTATIKSYQYCNYRHGFDRYGILETLVPGKQVRSVTKTQTPRLRQHQTLSGFRTIGLDSIIRDEQSGNAD
jgi:hypothetical protein